MDSFYTPTAVAQEIVAALDIGEPAVAGDFAAGDGALLAAVRHRWPSCQLVASDIQPTAVSGLRNRFAGIDADVVDFLSREGRAASRVLRGAVGRVSLVMLNPPFSCRGGAHVSVELDGRQLTCSRAMAFLINAIPYVATAGRTVALLPASCLTSEKDAAAISALSHVVSLEQIGGAKPYDFLNCSVHVSFVTLRRRTGLPADVALRSALLEGAPTRSCSISLLAALSRGSIPMHLVERLESADGLPFVHTTDLRDGSVAARRSVETRRSIVTGPVILMPRVGMPSASKLCLIDRPESIAISDCIVAISPKPPSEVHDLFQRMKTHWPVVEEHYGGSCAPYITLKRLARALQIIGIRGIVCAKNTHDSASTPEVSGRGAVTLAA